MKGCTTATLIGRRKPGFVSQIPVSTAPLFGTEIIPVLDAPKCREVNRYAASWRPDSLGEPVLQANSGHASRSTRVPATQ